MSTPTTQVVRPAGAGHETLYVLLLCLMILAVAGSVVLWRGESHEVSSVSSHQLDARRDLSASEQGIYADLRVTLDEIHLLRQEQQALPTPEALAEEGFAPFAQDASSVSRGGHAWQLLDAKAYFGQSQTPTVAGSFLMRLSAADDAPDIWLNRASNAHGTGRPQRRRARKRRLAADRRAIRCRRDPPAPALNPRLYPREDRFPMPNSSQRSFLRLLLVGLLACLLPPLASADEAKRLRIGITLHPYYSYVANIVGDKAEVVPLIPAGFNPHAYEPRAEDIKRISGLDVIVLNGVGHDDFADRMIAASETPNVPVIEANENVPLLAATGVAARGAGKVVNPHTFLSISASIAQVNNIARELGKLDPANAKTYTENARAYGKRLRKMRADALAKLTQAPNAELRVATVHAAYDYLLREFGLEVTAVVEPAHGIEPSPSQLKKTIDQLRELDVKVIFSEMDFPSTYVDTIQRESGVKLYPLSHISYGEYTADKYEKEMTGNLNTVVRAIQESGA